MLFKLVQFRIFNLLIMFCLKQFSNFGISNKIIQIISSNFQKKIQVIDCNKIYDQNEFYVKILPYIARFNVGKEINRYADFKFVNSFRMKLDINEYTQSGYFFGILDYDLISVIKAGGDVFVDIGANVGLFSILGSQTFNKVISIEPSNHTFNMLENNIKLNSSSKRISAIEMALSNENGTMKLFHNPLNNGGSSLNEFEKINKRKHLEYSWETSSVKVEKMDKILTDVEGNIDFIKVDVEGSELKVIEGGLEIIKLHSPLLYIEVSGDYHKFIEIYNLLPSSYFAYSLFNKKEIFKTDSEIPPDLLFIPKNKEYILDSITKN